RDGGFAQRLVEDVWGGRWVELQCSFDGAVEADSVGFHGALNDPRREHRRVEVVVSALHRERIPSLPGLAILLDSRALCVDRDECVWDDLGVRPAWGWAMGEGGNDGSQAVYQRPWRERGRRGGGGRFVGVSVVG